MNRPADPTWRPDYRSHAGGPSSGRTAPPIFQGVSFRQRQPTLTAEFYLARASTRGGPDGSFITLRISISLKNTSSVSARFPYLIIEGTSNVRLPGFNARRGFQYPPGVFEGGADDVIHPERIMRAQDLEKEFK